MKPAHHRGGGFCNSDPDVVIGDFPWYDMVWRGLRGDFRPRVKPVGGYAAFARDWSVPVDRARLAQRPPQPTVTWLGHVTILLQVAGLNILTDPTLAGFAGPYGRFGALRQVPAPLMPRELPPIDLVLVSHNHYDHLDDASVRTLHAQPGGPPLFVVPLGLELWLQAEGITRSQPLDWWSRHTVDAPGGPVQVSLVPAQHWSRRSLFDRNASLWGGFVVQAQASGAPVSLFYTGDTGYSPDFAEIGRRFGGFDLAMIPVGCHLPRWFMQRQHVNEDDALRIHADVKSRLSVGVHWGSFRLCDDPIDAPLDGLPAARSRAGVAADTFVLLGLGETRVIRPAAR